MLLAAMLVAKLLVPAGWMPVQSPSGIAIMLCSGDGPALAWIDAAGTNHKGHQDGEKHGQAKDPCPYGALTAAADAPSQLALAHQHLAPASGPIVPTTALAIGRGLAAPPPPATGPPHFA